jgi:hypothetical protein
MSVHFEGAIDDAEVESLERLVRRGAENPQLYVSSVTAGIACLVAGSLAAVRSSAWVPAALVAMVGHAANESTGRPTGQSWRRPDST